MKKAHQIQEIGEFQEMSDDVEYLLDALQPLNPMSTRCLSAIQLAQKCMTPSFRMHVRAHGMVTKFFSTLMDAAKNPSLGKLFSIKCLHFNLKQSYKLFIHYRTLYSNRYVCVITGQFKYGSRS